MIVLATIVLATIALAAALSCIPTRRKAAESEDAKILAGATFGPWADHAARCTCTVCR